MTASGCPTRAQGRDRKDDPSAENTVETRDGIDLRSLDTRYISETLYNTDRTML